MLPYTAVRINQIKSASNSYFNTIYDLERLNVLRGSANQMCVLVDCRNVKYLTIRLIANMYHYYYFF